MHRELTGTSVHSAPYTRPDAPAPDAALERAMREIRTLARLGRARARGGGHQGAQPSRKWYALCPNNWPVRSRRCSTCSRPS
jgi:hypothetical protein